MGIPSLFSHLLQYYTSTIAKYNPRIHKIDELYLDSNGFIYNALRELETDQEITEEKIISKTIQYINEKIKEYSPRETVIIAFDGIASPSKIKQQIVRRKRNIILQQLEGKTNANQWTNQITAGTPFMTKLSQQIEHYYLQMKHQQLKYVIYSANIEGEGEHKIMQHIKTAKKYKKKAIYGLDGDLILLGLLANSNITIYRELEINNTQTIDLQQLRRKISIYWFDEIMYFILSVLLMGNDYLPHIYGLSIREKGLVICHSVLKKYKNSCKIWENNKLQWNSFNIFLQKIGEELEFQWKQKMSSSSSSLSLSSISSSFLQQNTPPTTTLEDILNGMQEENNYIAKGTKGWQTRFKKVRGNYCKNNATFKGQFMYCLEIMMEGKPTPQNYVNIPMDDILIEEIIAEPNPTINEIPTQFTTPNYTNHTNKLREELMQIINNQKWQINKINKVNKRSWEINIL